MVDRIGYKDSSRVNTLCSKGKRALLKGSYTKALNTFLQLLSEESYSVGMTLFVGNALLSFALKEKSHFTSLLDANKILKKASKVHPQEKQIHMLRTAVLFQLGKSKRQAHFLHSTLKINAQLQESKQLSQQEKSDTFWLSAMAYYHQSQISGEAYDLGLALQQFHQAEQLLTSNSALFFFDYAKVLFSLAEKTNLSTLYIRSANYLKKSLLEDGEFTDSWFYLGLIFKKRYLQNFDIQIFKQALSCLEVALIQDPHNALIYETFIETLLQGFHLTQDPEHLIQCEELLHKTPKNSTIVKAMKAHCKAALGLAQTRTSLLSEGERLATEMVEEADTPAVWFHLGMCVSYLARYFSDNSLYQWSIECFQSGFSLDRTQNILQESLGWAYYEKSLLENDLSDLSQSIKFFCCALKNNHSPYSLLGSALAYAKLGEWNWDEEALLKAKHFFDIIKEHYHALLYQNNTYLLKYALLLDMIGESDEEANFYMEALHIMLYLLTQNNCPQEIHHHLGQVFCHYGEFLDEKSLFLVALHQYTLGSKIPSLVENDQFQLDWGILYLHLAEHASDKEEIHHFYEQAAYHIAIAGNLGSLLAPYYLACYHALKNHYLEALYFLSLADKNETLPPLEELLNDAWLTSLHLHPPFQKFIAILRQREKMHKNG